MARNTNLYSDGFPRMTRDYGIEMKTVITLVYENGILRTFKNDKLSRQMKILLYTDGLNTRELAEQLEKVFGGPIAELKPYGDNGWKWKLGKAC